MRTSESDFMPKGWADLNPQMTQMFRMAEPSYTNFGLIQIIGGGERATLLQGRTVL